MPDYAAKMHFRTAPDSDVRRRGFAGGYGWFLGRFPDWETFQHDLREHLRSLGYIVIEVETSLEVDGPADLNPGEQQELFVQLAQFPIQYRTLHMYKVDDA